MTERSEAELISRLQHLAIRITADREQSATAFTKRINEIWDVVGGTRTDGIGETDCWSVREAAQYEPALIAKLRIMASIFDRLYMYSSGEWESEDDSS